MLRPYGVHVSPKLLLFLRPYIHIFMFGPYGVHVSPKILEPAEGIQECYFNNAPEFSCPPLFGVNGGPIYSGNLGGRNIRGLLLGIFHFFYTILAQYTFPLEPTCRNPRMLPPKNALE